MAEALTANGLNLNPTSGWCWVEDLNPLLAVPARRGDNVVVPGRHGTIRTPNKYYTDADLVVPMWVLGVDRATGVAPADTYRALHDNIDVLLKVFATPTVLLLRDRGDGYPRVAAAEPMLEPVVVERQRSAPAAAKVAVALNLFGAFWADQSSVTQPITGPSGTTVELDAFAAATAPMSDLTVTFTGPVNNPLLIHGAKTLQYHGAINEGQRLVINTEHWQLTPGAGDPWSPDLRQIEFFPGPTYFELDPATPGFSVQFAHTGGGSASCQITGPRRYLSP